jgi:hypothetical protein
MTRFISFAGVLFVFGAGTMAIAAFDHAAATTIKKPPPPPVIRDHRPVKPPKYHHSHTTGTANASGGVIVKPTVPPGRRPPRKPPVVRDHRPVPCIGNLC